MQTRRLACTVLMATSVLITMPAAGCGHRGEAAATRPTDGKVRLYGVDSNMSNALKYAVKDNPGALSGMKGTSLPLPSDDLLRRLRGIDPGAQEWRYAAETYDAVIIAALASELAQSTEPGVFAKQIIGITVGGTTCETARACLDAIRRGQDVSYRGASIRRSGFTDVGEPSTASFATLTFGRDDMIDSVRTEVVGAGDEATESRAVPPSVVPATPASPSPSATSSKPASAPPSGSVTQAPRTERPLRYGLLAPRSGPGAGYTGAKLAGARLAVAEINEAGGVLGVPVYLADADDGDRGDVAAVAIDRFISANGVQVIIAAGSSTVCQAVLPRTVAARVVLMSPSASSDNLTKADDKGLFFRTAPPDALQAKALADIVLRDGSQRIVVVARDDPYGTGLQRPVQGELGSAGVKSANLRLLTYRAKDKYDPATDLDGIFKPVAKAIAVFAPDAVVLIGYPESAYVIKAMLTEGVQLKN